MNVRTGRRNFSACRISRRALLLVVLPLTVLAAVMECYVTPVVMGLFL